VTGMARRSSDREAIEAEIDRMRSLGLDQLRTLWRTTLRSSPPPAFKPTRRALLQDVELMPQHQDFGFKPPSGLEAVAQHADEKEGNCEHPAIMF